MRRPWIQGARRPAHGSVLEQYVEHGGPAQRRLGLIVRRSRKCVRMRQNPRLQVRGAAVRDKPPYLLTTGARSPQHVRRFALLCTPAMNFSRRQARYFLPSLRIETLRCGRWDS